MSDADTAHPTEPDDGSADPHRLADPDHPADPEHAVPLLSLAGLGVLAGEPVRFRKAEGGRWFAGKIATSNPDGSMTLYDANGAARSLFPDRIEIQRPGARGKMAWITLADLATTSEQMRLF